MRQLLTDLFGRVGFGPRFGVKLAGYGLWRAASQRFFDGGKRFKWLQKLTGKGKAADVMHITWFDLECI